jgi:hypothetical protein
MYIFLGNYTQLFETFAPEISEPFLAESDDFKNVIERDIARAFFLGNKKAHETYKDEWLNTIDKAYSQGNHDGGSIFVPLHQTFPPVKEIKDETILIKYADIRFGYVDAEGNLCGASILFDKDNPQHWLIGILRKGNKAPDERQITLITSADLSNLKNNDVVATISPVDAKKMLEVATGSKLVSHLLTKTLDDQGQFNENIIAINQVIRYALPSSEPSLTLVKLNLDSILTSERLLKLARLDINTNEENVALLLDEDSQLSQWFDRCTSDKQIEALLQLSQKKQHDLIPLLFKHDYLSQVVISMISYGLSDELTQLAKKHHYFAPLIRFDVLNGTIFKGILHDEDGYADLIEVLQQHELTRHVATVMSDTNDALRHAILTIEKQCQQTQQRLNMAPKNEKIKAYLGYQSQYKKEVYGALCLYFASKKDEEAKTDFETRLKETQSQFVSHALQIERAPMARKFACFVVNLLSHITGIGLAFNAYHKYKTGNWLFYSEPQSKQDFSNLNERLVAIASA